MKAQFRTIIVLGSLFLCLSACSSVPSPKEVELWQAKTIAAQRGNKQTLIHEIRAIDKIRAGDLEIEQSRSRCLALLKRFPNVAPVLWRAARAESDYLLILKSRKATQWEQNLAALSSLQFAQRARALLRQENTSAALLGQLAWSMRNSARLKGIFSQSDWASETLKIASLAISRNKEECSALAALTVLHRHLATRTDIVQLMSSRSPKGSLKESIELGLRGLKLRPSLENHVLLARSYLAAEEYEKADDLLQSALKKSDRYPRDRYYREQAMQILDITTYELNKYQL